jgi:superfamily II DNA or RNA helicase
MNHKLNVKSATISDKIYIKEEDIEDRSAFEKAYTYQIVDDFHYTYEYNENNGVYAVPSNSYHKLKIENIEDLRNFEDAIHTFSFNGSLRPEQQVMVDSFFQINDRIRSGLFQAPCGWGKTYVGCNLIARANKPTLILLHTKLLFRQWIDELEKQIPGIKIGKVGDGLLDIQEITVGIYKSVLNNIDELHDKFGLLLVDEAHLCPADMFSQAVNSINCRAKIAISATPRRKDGKHIVLDDYFTTFKAYAEDPRVLAIPKVEIFQTDIRFNVLDPKRDWSRQTNKLALNSELHRLIAEKAIEKVNQGRCILILGERLDWLRELNKIIPDSVLMIGGTLEEQRKEVLENVGPKYKVVLTTKLFDEGISCHRLDTLFLVFPSNNPIKLEQRIGRIIREHVDKQRPLVCDFWLTGAIVYKQQNNRRNWYIQRGYSL